MLNGEKIVVVMPAYNAARTLRQTYEEMMAHGIVDHVIVVDDASHDDTVAIARTLDRAHAGSRAGGGASGKPRLRRESKDLLPPRACCRGRHLSS
jgi:GT2 family glycosyltransferase